MNIFLGKCTVVTWPPSQLRIGHVGQTAQASLRDELKASERLLYIFHSKVIRMYILSVVALLI